MIAALCALGGALVTALLVWLRDKTRDAAKAATDTELQKIVDRAKDREREIDEDATPKPRTEQEIRDELARRARSPRARR